MAQMVAGAVGFTFTWNPQAGVAGNVETLTDLTCSMVVELPSSGYRASFPMAVASNGLTASYTTLLPSDFPTPGAYNVQFIASNGSTVVLSTQPQIYVVAPAL